MLQRLCTNLHYCIVQQLFYYFHVNPGCCNGSALFYIIFYFRATVYQSVATVDKVKHYTILQYEYVSVIYLLFSLFHTLFHQVMDGWLVLTLITFNSIPGRVLFWVNQTNRFLPSYRIGVGTVHTDGNTVGNNKLEKV